MKKMIAHPENGEITINGHKMAFRMKRTKSESAFGVRGSRIFELEIKKDGEVCGVYTKGWTKQISKEDEESALFLSYLVDRYGKAKKNKKKEMGSQE